ncbi:hypothetical protein NC653_019445 [Populus alba x Populus x berolinensis]|uniref:Uncharacterized protein n=1 Tax=Populus alba x Populus x berolinensis TaxID=444605 RepID=A0AAD6QIX0_9ROSI|nr:hypothetical protein NC653_019445 [Populus alba x Populus x berolinensis]
MNRKKKSIQVRRIGRGKGIHFPFSYNLTFPCPLYFQSLHSLVPIFLPTRKLKEKIAFHYFFPSGF